MILLVDNYDSFSYNLYQLAGGINTDIRVVRNDKLSSEEILEMAPTHVILSPGPGYPKDAGICEAAIRKLGGKIPILGVCLGHQAICEVFGARISHARKLMHGKKSDINLDTSSLIFKGLPDIIEAARYHSLAAESDNIPSCLKVIAWDEMGEVMAVSHSEHEIYGLQFHPESILTPLGESIIRNFLELEGAKNDS